MNRLVLRSCFLVVLSLMFAAEATAKEDHASAIVAIAKLGGTVSYDDRREKVLTVSLRYCNVTDGDLLHVSKLTDLTRLDLSDTRVTDAGLEHLKGLTKLEHLSFYNTDVGDAVVELIAGMPKLNFLLLKRTYVTEAGYEKLKRALPSCETNSVSPRVRQRPAASLPVGNWSVTFAKPARLAKMEPRRSLNRSARARGRPSSAAMRSWSRLKIIASSVGRLWPSVSSWNTGIPPSEFR